MSLRNMFLGTALALTLTLGVAGCDGSSAELDKTKAELAQANQERSNLKTELDASKSQVTALQNKVNELNGKLAAAPAPKPPEPAHASVTTPKKDQKAGPRSPKTAAKSQKG